MKKKRLIVGFISLLLFGGYTYLVKTIDVQKVGEQSITVGFATLNGIFNGIIGYNEGIYNLSNYIGYLCFVICGIYGSIGIIQLIIRKDVRKVDKEIILLGFLYVTILIIKIVFDNLIIINYRPYYIDGILESSYPSSHTVMALVVSGSAIIINKKKYNNIIAKIGNYICMFLMISIIVTRVLSGVHWCTDIIGSIILSFSLLLIYSGLITGKGDH